MITSSSAEYEKVQNYNFLTRWFHSFRYKELHKVLGKTDGRKKSHVGVEKLEDANYAGKRQSRDCTLCVTEGDSAASYARKYAMNGLFAISEHTPDADTLDNSKVKYTSKADIERGIKSLDAHFEQGNTKEAKAIFEWASKQNPEVTQVQDRYIMLFGTDDVEGM